MQYCGSTAKYFDLRIKKWSTSMSPAECMTEEQQMFAEMQTGAKVELLTTRCHTSKPSSDRRFKWNSETRNALSSAMNTAQSLNAN